MLTATYGWVWSWNETSDIDLNDPHYPDNHNSTGYHWITIYSYGTEGVDEEICILPLYTAYDKWRELIGDREQKAQLIVDALDRDLQDAGG